MTDEEIRKYLEAVPDSYRGFVIGVMGYIKMDCRIRHRFEEFAKEHPQTTMDDISDNVVNPFIPW